MEKLVPKTDLESGQTSDDNTVKCGQQEVCSERNSTRAPSIASLASIGSKILGPLRALRMAEKWSNRRMGIETRGNQRVHEDQKETPPEWNMFFLWFSLTCHIGTLPLGLLGPMMGLALGPAASACVVGIALGALCPAFCATLGPVTGLRAVATCRYAYGYWGAKLCALKVIIVGGGFTVVNFVTTGHILSAASEYAIGPGPGIILVAVMSYVVSFFGFKIIHHFVRYAWTVTFILLCVLLGQSGPYIGASTPSSIHGLQFAGQWLTFMALNFSNASGWCSISADYYCHYPAKISKVKVFLLTHMGITLPLVFTTIVGICLGNAALLHQYEPFYRQYEAHSLGGLLHEAYHPASWAKFCLVILTFSIMANNIAAVYSSGLSLQFFGRYCQAIPRFLWSLLFTVITTILAVVGKDHLADIVSNFVALLGYWAVSYTAVLLIEDRWFRSGHPEYGYDLDVWNSAKRLPIGAAAVTSTIAGYLAGALPGMAHTMYVGPIASKFGGDGGDVGIFLSAAITVVLYIPLRYVERKYSHR